MSVKIHHVVYSEPSPESSTLFQAVSTALTGSYALIGAEMPTEGATTINLGIRWTKGDETSIEIKAEYSNTSGGTTLQPTVITTEAAESTLEVESFKFDTASDNFVIPFGVHGRFVKFYIKATGGIPTGTYGAEFYSLRE